MKLPRLPEVLARPLRGPMRKILGMESLAGAYSTGLPSGRDRGYGRLDGDPLKALAENERWIWAAIDAIAEAEASIGIELYRQAGGAESEDDWEQIHQHASLDLLECPNPEMDGHELRYITRVWLELWGNALWYKMRMGRGGEPEEIWPIPWHHVEPVWNEGRNRVLAWRWKPGIFGKREDMLAEDVIHWRKPNAANLKFGRGTVMAIAKAVDLLHYCTDDQIGNIRSGSRVGATIEANANATQQQLDHFYETYQENHAGPGRAGFPLVVRSGWKVQPQPATGNREGDYRATSQDAIDEQLAIFRVPRAILGQSKEYNRANLSGALFAFQKFAVDPRIKGTVRKLQKEFFGDPVWRDPRALWIVEHEEFIERDVAQDLEVLKTKLGAATGVPLVTPNEARQLLGMPADEEEPGMARYWIGANLRGIDEPPATVGAPVTGKAFKPASANDIVWKRFSAKHSQAERKILAAYKATLKEQEREVKANLRRAWGRHAASVAGWGKEKARAYLAEQKGLAETIFPKPDAEAKRMEKATHAARKDATLAAARATFRDIGVDRFKLPTKDADTDEMPDIPEILDEAVEVFVRELGLSNIKLLNATTTEQLREKFVEILADGGTLDDLMEAAVGVYQGIDYRAWRTARTEATAGWNWGSLEAAHSAEESGLTVRKAWVSAQDDRTREAHQEASATYAEGIPLDEPFEIDGEALMYPGDPDGSAENVINCRCTLVYLTGSD